VCPSSVINLILRPGDSWEEGSAAGEQKILGSRRGDSGGWKLEFFNLSREGEDLQTISIVKKRGGPWSIPKILRRPGRIRDCN